MCRWRLLGFLLLVVSKCSCFFVPVNYHHNAIYEGDTAIVGSLRRDVRAPAPLGFSVRTKDLAGAGNSPKESAHTKKEMKNASGKTDEGGYYKTYGGDAEGGKGYLRKTYSNGDQGYKSFDTFHKQDSDSYGFDKETVFGSAKFGGEAGSAHDGGSTSSKHDNEGAGTIVDTHYADSEGEHFDEGESSSRYTAGGEDDGDQNSGEYGAHYQADDAGSGSYGDGEVHGENYSTADSTGRSYGTHTSYSSGSGEIGNYDGGHH